MTTRRLRDLGLPDQRRRTRLDGRRAVRRADRRRPRSTGWSPTRTRAAAPALWRRPLAGGAGERGDPGARVRPQPGHEYGGGEYAVARRRWSSTPSSPTAGSTGSPTAGPQPITPAGRVPLRRPPAAPRPRAGAGGPGGPLRRRRAGQHHRRARPGRSERRRRHRAVLRRRLLLHARAVRRRPAGLDRVEPPEHALGRRARSWSARSAGRRCSDAVAVAGGPGESAVQPRWLGDAADLAVSDRTDWWNLYRVGRRRSQPLHPEDAEFASRSGFSASRRTRCWTTTTCSARSTAAVAQSVAILTMSTGELVPVADTGVADQVAGRRRRAGRAVRAHPDRAPGSPARPRPPDLDRRAQRGRPPPLDPGVGLDGRAGQLAGRRTVRCTAGSTRRPIPTTRAGRTAGRRCWSCPTAARPASPTAAFMLAHQFWTSRGFAVLDVNYGGSAGFGRAYRDACADAGASSTSATASAGAQAMVEQGRADPARLVIRGGSAGGYTTLRALTSSDVFAAGISLYGVGDLEALARDTHKFESRYLDGLVGPYPEAREIYLDRSPITPRRPAVGTDPAAAGHRGPGGAAEPGRDDGRGRPGQGPAGGHDHVRRRGPRLPPGRLDQVRDRRPRSTSWAGSSASPRPTRCRRSRSTTC